MSRPPNILYIMTDQQKASACSVYGNRHVPCAFQERMAAEGITFRHAYAPSSICTPSRTSVFTGVHPLVHQVTCHQNRAPLNLPQLSELLMAQGYYTSVLGHYEQARNLTRGWHEQVSFKELGPLHEAFRRKYTSGRRDVGLSAGSIGCAPEEGQSYLIAERAIRMLDQIEASGRPYFLHVAFDDPHPPYFVPPPYDTLIDPDSIDLPAFGDPAHLPAWQQRTRAECGTANAAEDDVRNLVATYYGMIACVNDQMLRLYEAMEARGLLENTWVVTAADHGDFTGEKGLFAKCESLYECLLHVPLIVRPPDGSDLPRGMAIDGLVDLTDLFPSILAMAGVATPDYAQGSDLVAWVRGGRSEPLHEVVFAQVGGYHGALKTTFPTGMPESGRHPSVLQAARSPGSSFVHDPDYGDEAYDLRSDPAELRNLLNDRSGATLEIEELRRRAQIWQAECLRLREALAVVPGDRGFVAGWE